MKQALIPFMLFFLLISCELDVSSTDDSNAKMEIISEEEALALLHKWTDAYLNKDLQALEQVLDDSWIYSGSPDGNITDKAATLDEFSNADYRFEEITYEDLEVKLYGDIAVVRGSEEMVIIGDDGKDTTELRLRFTDVYQKKQGRIRAISTHSSPVAVLPEAIVESNFSRQKMEDFQWMNPPESFEILEGTLKIQSNKGTDFFNNPVDGKVTATAPFLYQTVKGDFVATALVRPDFSSLWNAVALMVHIDDKHWIKFAFENSDATGKSIVSVVTKEISDDANGVILEEPNQIWLKLIRKENVYSMLWSQDGDEFKMARLGTLPASESVKIGIEAQCPVGEVAVHEIEFFEIDLTSVKDLRKGF